MASSAASPSYGRGHRVLEIASIVFVLAALAWLGYQIAITMDGAIDLLWVGASALTGYLVSDFLSGLVHWAGDTVGDESTPVFGPNFVRPFRYHHVDPVDIARHDFVETNGNNCIVVAPVLVAIILTMPDETGVWFYGSVIATFTALFVFCTNQFHKWAHMESPPIWIRALQRSGLILSPEHHAVHHAAPHDRHYCITVGWMNPILDRLGFFRALETVVSRISPRALRPDT
jgi:hypothetical protein